MNRIMATLELLIILVHTCTLNHHENFYLITLGTCALSSQELLFTLVHACHTAMN